MAQWSRLKKSLVIGTGTLVGLFVLVIILALVLPEPESTQQGPAQPESTDVPPTATAIPIPTLSPTPTAPPTPECPSVGEQIYFLTMADIMGRLAEDLIEFSSLSLEAGANWLVTQDSSWVLDVALVLSGFQVTADEISSISAPQSVQPIHSDMLQVASSLRAVVPLFSRGVDNLDADLILAATQQMEEIGRLASVINGKAESFCQ